MKIFCTVNDDRSVILTPVTLKRDDELGLRSRQERSELTAMNDSHAYEWEEGLAPLRARRDTVPPRAELGPDRIPPR